MKILSFSQPISVAILYYAGTSDDDLDTMQAAKGIEKSLTRLGHSVRKRAVTKKNWLRAVKTPGDVVFNLVEDDTWELYLKVGKRLEAMGRAQVGHDMKCLKYTTRKALIKRRMKQLGIRTPNYKIIDRTSKTSLPDGLKFPMIVKPSAQHAGIGISQDSVVVIQDALDKQMKSIFDQFPGEIVIEEYIQGREIHVTICGNGEHPSVLPLCEIGFEGKFHYNWSVYTYKAKWDKKSWEYWDARVSAPAKLPRELQRSIKTLATRAYKAFACRDIARMDVRIDENGQPFLVDVNMNPSLNYYDQEDATLASAYAMKWTYDQFLETIVATTYKRVYGQLK